MTWAHWVLVAYFALGALGAAYLHDKPRPRTTGGDVVVQVVISVFFIWLVMAVL